MCIRDSLGIVIDVIVQFNRDERGRFISEIAYEPRRKQHTDDATRDAMADAQATLFGGFRT